MLSSPPTYVNKTVLRQCLFANYVVSFSIHNEKKKAFQRYGTGHTIRHFFELSGNELFVSLSEIKHLVNFSFSVTNCNLP